MVTLAESVTKVRTAAVLNLIRNTVGGLTLQELADEGGYSPQTARNYVARLVEDGLVEASAEYRKPTKTTGRGSIIFIPANTNLMPIFITPAGNKRTLWEHLSAVIRNPVPVGAITSIRRTNRNYAKMFYRAKHHSTGTNLDLSNNDLIRLRQEFYEDIATLELHIKNVRHMLTDDVLWSNPKEFRLRLLGDPLSPVDLDEVDAFEQTMDRRLTATKDSQ